MSRKMRVTLTVVVIVALVGSGLLALVWSQQRRLIYFPSPGPLPSATTILPAGKDVVLDTEDGLRLAAWYFPAPSHDRAPAVVIFNGNAGYRWLRADLAVALNRHGLSVLLFDYRGYRGNPGRPTEEGLAADARTSTRAGSRTSANPWARQSQSSWPCTDRLRRWCCGRRSRRWPTSACCTTRGCRCGSC